jgi:EmrB/QacA subfamily drug resistance transporter
LALALMLPLNSWLVDRLGAKKLYVACFSAFTIASFLCGMATTMPQLIAARVVQGISGGLLAPLAQLMLARIAGKQMARVVGYAAAPVLLAPLFGPLLAGAILKYAGWPWLFYVNLPVGVVAVILALIIIPHDDGMIQKRPFDLPGFLLLSPGVSCLLYGFERISHREGLAILLAGVILLLAFVWLAKRKQENALIDIGLFKIPIFATATITQFLSNGIIYAGQFLVPYYLISGAGLEPARAGWLLSAMGVGMLCVYPLMGNITDRFGCRPVAATGVLINFLGTLPFLWMARGELSIPLAMIGLFLRGMGQGATGIPSIAAAYASVPKEKLSLATTAVNIVQRLGGPLMTTGLAVVVSFSEGAQSTQTSHAFFIPFLTLIIFQFLVLASAIRLPMRIHADAELART